jgi:hypothetical protein
MGELFIFPSGRKWGSFLFQWTLFDRPSKDFYLILFGFLFLRLLISGGNFQGPAAEMF